jgi:hypothetical protein
MFSDTITITINSIAKALVRINQDGYSSEYLLKETDGEFRLRLRNSSYTDKNRGATKVDRHNVELVHTLYPVAPAVYPTVRKFYSIFENDNGDSTTSNVKFEAGIVAFHSEANLTKLLNWES